MSSVREHLERWRDRHEEAVAYLLADGMEFDDPHAATSKGYCETCGKTWPCPDFEDAVAALDGLADATRIDWTGREDSSFAFDDGGDYLVISDPDPRRCHAGCHYIAHDDPFCDDCGGPNPNAFRVDPLVPRLDANPNKGQT